MVEVAGDRLLGEVLEFNSLDEAVHIPGAGEMQTVQEGPGGRPLPLAVKWAGDGIRVNAVAPGLIDTPMTAPMHSIPSLLDGELAHIPLRRLGTTAEVAATVAFLCTEHSSYTSGAVFVVDGASDCV